MSFHLLAYVSFAVVVVILLLLLAEFVQRVTLLAAALENQKKENTELRKAVKRTTKDLFAKAFEHDRCKAELEEQLSGNELAIEDLKLDHSRLNDRIQDLERNLRLEHSSTVCLQQRYDSLRAFNQYLQDALRERDLKAEEAGRRVLAAAGRADQAARDQTKEVYERMIQRLEMDSLEKIADIRRTASDAEAKLLKEKMSNLEVPGVLFGRGGASTKRRSSAYSSSFRHAARRRSISPQENVSYFADSGEIQRLDFFRTKAFLKDEIRFGRP
ncbi:hypothetical protein FRB90_008448 [Tulasnella sp. 427]|nr:hypothetical protein FRB90_008448 [Tulasnella sp. 427]